MTSSLVGSEMCIRDSPVDVVIALQFVLLDVPESSRAGLSSDANHVPVSYTHLTLPTICSV
eukprot:3795275-Prorocentrum_lima.AAC.1